MIEITTENVWYKKKKRKFKTSRIVRLIIIFLVLIGVFLYYKKVICSQINSICFEYANSCSIDCVNVAVLESLNEQVTYQDLITVEKNLEGDIVHMQANSLKINYISREIASKTKEIFESEMEKGVPIPLMAFTGFNLLSGYGKKVSVKTINVASVKSDFESKFYSVGINQTLHSIYVLVQTEINIHTPFNTQKRGCKTSVLICENVIVGKVPDMYLGGKFFN